MTTSRETPVQQGPPEDLGGFPVRRMAPSAMLHRAHRAARGPWWFSSAGGRFDLPAPRGTCYLATSALVAVREWLGPVLARRASLPATTLDGVVVSRLPVGERGTSRHLLMANLRVEGAAAFGVTRELESMTPYEIPALWARALAEAGLDGVWYGPRFTPGRASAAAVFGRAGVAEHRPEDANPVEAARVPGVPGVVGLPRRRDLTVIAAPRRPARRHR